jgi:hypothetical protein
MTVALCSLLFTSLTVDSVLSDSQKGLCSIDLFVVWLLVSLTA